MTPPSRVGLIAVLLLAPVGARAASMPGACQFELKVAPGQAAGLKADASLSAQFPQLETSLRLAVTADPNLARTDSFAPIQPAVSQESLGLSAAWTAPAGARVEFSLGDRLGQSWTPLSFTGGAAQAVRTDERSAAVSLVLAPIRDFDVSLSGATSQRTAQDEGASPSLASTSGYRFETTSQSAGGDLRWKIAPWLSLKASGKVEAASADWRGAVAGASLDYAYFQPTLTGSVTLPGAGRLDLSLDHAVSPLDPGALSALAQVADPATARFGPDREWRYRVSLKQTLVGAVRISAALTQARIESATELGPAGSGQQAPISVFGGERQQVDLSVSTPLAAIGLPSFTLKGVGSWRSSAVRDPFTGQWRQASAESPQQASLGLVQSLKNGRWGLEGRFGGDQSLYQMSQVTHVSVADSLGAFVEYAPGPFAVRLQVDGLYGGERHYSDLYFSGPRGGGYPERIDRRTDSSQSVQLVLRKTL